MWLGLLASLAAQETIFRGVVQRSIEEDLAVHGIASWRARGLAAAFTVLLGLVAVVLGDLPASRAALLWALAGQLGAALARAATGRVGAAWAARAAGILGSAFF